MSLLTDCDAFVFVNNSYWHKTPCVARGFRVLYRWIAVFIVGRGLHETSCRNRNGCHYTFRQYGG